MKEIFARAGTEEQLDALLDERLADSVIISCGARISDELVCRAGACGMNIYIQLPDVLRENTLKEASSLLEKAAQYSGAVIENIDELGMIIARDFRGRVIADSFLYASNREAVSFYLKYLKAADQCEDHPMFIANDELTGAELGDLEKSSGADLIFKAYGCQKLMVTAQDIAKANGAAGGSLKFENASGDHFFSELNKEFGYTCIYNSVPTYIPEYLNAHRARAGSAYSSDKVTDLGRHHEQEKVSYVAEKVLFDFTRESRAEVIAVMNGSYGGPAVRGHFLKGTD